MEALIGIVVWIVLLFFPFWKIFGKAGMSPYLTFILLIPGLGAMICIIILAFARWPALDEG